MTSDERVEAMDEPDAGDVEVTYTPHAGTPFEGRYPACALDAAGNCHRWNHEHEPATPADPDPEVQALTDAIVGCFEKSSNLPQWMQIPALGRDMRPLREIAARAVLSSGWPDGARRAAYNEGYDKAMRDAHHVLNQMGYLERRGEDNGNPY